MKKHLLSLLLFVTSGVFAQEAFPELSPKCSIKQKVGFTFISIDYERPAARGRKIFGDLVPYSQVWRTGAGNCTKIGFDRAVTIGNNLVDKGLYSLFTIPNKNEWVVIINRDTTLYGTRFYDEKKDVARIKVKSKIVHRSVESLQIDIDVIPNNARIYISWEQTEISFDIETGTDKGVNHFIEQDLLTDHSVNSENYAMAAEYYYYLNDQSERALLLINKVIARKKESWYYRQKIDILERLERYSEAIDCANLVISIDQQRSEWDSLTKQQSADQYKKRIIILQGKQKKRVSE